MSPVLTYPYRRFLRVPCSKHHAVTQALNLSMATIYVSQRIPSNSLTVDYLILTVSFKDISVPPNTLLPICKYRWQYSRWFLICGRRSGPKVHSKIIIALSCYNAHIGGIGGSSHVHPAEGWRPYVRISIEIWNNIRKGKVVIIWNPYFRNRILGGNNSHYWGERYEPWGICECRWKLSQSQGISLRNLTVY